MMTIMKNWQSFKYTFCIWLLRRLVRRIINEGRNTQVNYQMFLYYRSYMGL
jgi:hypothetical protein